MQKVYISDVAHCGTENCPRRKSCYRAWLAGESKEIQDEWATYNSPDPDNCTMYEPLED
ncbi:MAG: hypothetical protein IJY03_04595 [Prevotella sp.]|nr:hypothetical protein [Prevotella sp.]